LGVLSRGLREVKGGVGEVEGYSETQLIVGLKKSKGKRASKLTSGGKEISKPERGGLQGKSAFSIKKTKRFSPQTRFAPPGPYLNMQVRSRGRKRVPTRREEGEEKRGWSTKRKNGFSKGNEVAAQ